MTINSLPITLKTVTPIWTGGADGKSDSLHMTGIMGSLRWWYEVLVRGVGGWACDPTHPDKPKCLYDSTKPETFENVCDVCRIFGATGWARRFRLIISENHLWPQKPAECTDRSGKLMFGLSRDHPVTLDPEIRDPKWYLNSKPLYGQVTLEVIATAPPHKESKQQFDLKVIGALIQLIADRASIGAKPQMGLGVVYMTDRQSTQPLLDHLKQIAAIHEKNSYYDELPSLHNMFFARVRIDRSPTMESDTFDLKYDLRERFRQLPFADSHLRHTIMGHVQGSNRIGAKIMMSYPYDNGTIRMWGWIPKIARSNTSRNEIMNEIYYFLEDTYGAENVAFWLDFDSKKYDSMLEYLEWGLLKEAE